MAWSNPLPGRHEITARFGETGPRWASGRHTGLDFSAPTGTQAVAVDDGTVVFAGYSGRYGNLVKIQHGGSLQSWYAHLSSFDTTSLRRVSRGDPIGKVGSTGNTTGPHLHLEARVNGSPVDPEPYLSGSAQAEDDGGGGLFGLGGLVDAFGRVGDIVGFVTDAKNWQRVGLFVGGGGLVIVGLLVAAKKGIA